MQTDKAVSFRCLLIGLLETSLLFFLLLFICFSFSSMFPHKKVKIILVLYERCMTQEKILLKTDENFQKEANIMIFRNRYHYNSSYLLLRHNTTGYKIQLRESYFCQIEVTGGRWQCSPPKNPWIYKSFGSIGFEGFFCCCCFIWFTLSNTAVLILSWGIHSILPWTASCHQPCPHKHCQVSKFLLPIWRGIYSKEHP